MNRYFVLCALAGALACSKKEEAPRRTEPWLAHPSASGSAASPTGPLRFRFLAESQIHFTVPTRRARPAGSVPIADGSLELDARDPTRSKAWLDFDLLRLVADPESLPAGTDLGGAEPSSLAQRWLELGSDVPSERRHPFTRARFELSAVEDVTGALDFDRAGSKSSATIVGSLLLHGFRAPVRTRVSIQPQKASAEHPRRLSIRSLEPVVLSLAAHDVVFRSPAGIADAAQTERLRDTIGSSARVEFELVAEVESRP
jgi:hypothetical protein